MANFCVLMPHIHHRLAVFLLEMQGVVIQPQNCAGLAVLCQIRCELNMSVALH